MSKQAKLPASLLQPFDYPDKPASGYTSSSDEGNTWPEQETILAWLDKFSITADNEQVYELAQALTAERIRLAIGLAEKVGKLQAQVDKLNGDIRIMVEKAAAKYRPAYDEQAQTICKLQEQVDTLNSPVLKSEWQEQQDHIDKLEAQVELLKDAANLAKTYGDGNISANSILAAINGD